MSVVRVNVHDFKVLIAWTQIFGNALNLTNKINFFFSATICLSPPRIPDSDGLLENSISKIETSILVKSEDNKESLRPLLDKKVLSKSRDVNLDDEIKTKKIISTKRRPGLEKLIEKAKNQSKKNFTPQVNGEFVSSKIPIRKLRCQQNY